MNTETDSKSLFYRHMGNALKELERRLKRLVNEPVNPESKRPNQSDEVMSSVNLAQMLLALQERVHALEMKNHYKKHHHKLLPTLNGRNR